MIPDVFQQTIEFSLQKARGTKSSIVEVQSVSGGDIHQALKLTLDNGDTVFLKYNHEPLPKVFELEAKGLNLLRDTQTLKIPEVIAFHNEGQNAPAFLMLEWIETDGGSTDEVARQFGQGLAALHLCTHRQFGLEHDNYIGPLKQPNTLTSSWLEFYRDQRLRVQMEVARRRGRLDLNRKRKLEQLCDQLDTFIDDEVQPSLLHGDLWSGNYLISGQDVVVIDPAVYYGHREVELAFTELFGGFPLAFYQGYQEVFPIDAGYEDRKLLYQLYPLLVHLNLFGESYGAAVDRILSRYVG